MRRQRLLEDKVGVWGAPVFGVTPVFGVASVFGGAPVFGVPRCLGVPRVDPVFNNVWG